MVVLPVAFIQAPTLTIASSNMLYPKEDPDTHRLNFACRTCQYSEEAVSSCVFRNVLNNAVGETAGVTQDVGSDPTVCLPKSTPLLLSSALHIVLHDRALEAVKTTFMEAQGSGTTTGYFGKVAQYDSSQVHR
jgi:DNA-directed RNA polymerase subunit M/transcription elongation factor TFIIS